LPVIPLAGSSGPYSAQTLGLALGLVLGLLVLIGVLIGVCFLVIRERNGEHLGGEVELETESNMTEAAFESETEECQSGYQSQEWDSSLAGDFALSHVFSRDHEEMAFEI
jgi:hypothetical protein